MTTTSLWSRPTCAAILIVLVCGQIVMTTAEEACQLTCCDYCRSEPKHWVTLGGPFSLAGESSATSMQDPAAFLVDDKETAFFSMNGENYKLEYAGAPVRLRYDDLSDPDNVISNQYIQIDFASTRHVGGLMAQGGFYEEKLQGLYALRESWVTEFVVSYSNDTTNFQFHESSSDNILYFQGNKDPTGRKLVTFPQGIVARYVRFHPLKAQGQQGAVDTVNVRLTAITCSEEECNTPRINCLMTEWSDWSSCNCDSTCTKTRDREIRRVQACGGSKCPDLQETRACTPAEPLWKSVVQYVGIALAVIIVIAIIAFCIYKKKNKDRVEVIVVKDSEPVVEAGEKARPPLPRNQHGFSNMSAFHPPPGAAAAPPPGFNSTALPRQPLPPGMGLRQRPFQGPGTPSVMVGGMGGAAPVESNA